MTVNYSYTNGELALNPNLSAQDAAKGTAQFVELIAVEGKTNAYYIKYGEKYLTCTGKRAAALVDTPAEWAFTAHTKGGICLTDVASNVILGTAGATYNMLRCYVSPASSLVYGVVFFAHNGTTGGDQPGGETPTPDPDPTPEPEPTPDPTPDPTPGGVKTIAEILAAGNGASLSGTIEGVVVSNMALNNLTSKKGLYVQDETGALQFYLAANHELAFGTKVQIDLTGTTLGQYNGAVQVSGLALEKITTVSTGNTVEPKVVTMADFLANKYEGQYIALEGVQVASADLAKTWVTDGKHTSINMEDAAGNKFVVFSSKYASYGAETVAQGSGTIKGISSINNGTMQIIFAQASDYASLTGERFGTGTTPEPEPEPTPDPTPGEGTTVTATFNQMGFTNAQVVDGVDIKVDDNVTIKFSKANSSTAPAYYDVSNGIRMYQNGATLDVTANGKTITNIEFVFDYSQWYLGADSGTLSAEGNTRTWTGSATAVKFTSTGTDSSHRAYIKAMTITYK